MTRPRVSSTKRDGEAPVAERLKMGWPPRVSQYVRRFRPCQGSNVASFKAVVSRVNA